MKSWIELDLKKLKANVASLRSAIGQSTEIIYVVKADAYGHGVKHIASGAWDAGVRWYALAHVSEAREVRDLLPEANIMIVGPIDPSEAVGCADGRYVPMISGLEHGRAVAAAAAAAGVELECHAKIDTGMGRLGIGYQEAATDLATLRNLAGIRISGICTHFASAEGDSREFFDEQRKRFDGVLQDLEAAGIEPGFRHASNSGAVFLEPEADFDGVRPGIMLYGYGPSAAKREVKIRPILQWRARVGQVRKIPAGSNAYRS
jgi:alanine racemase